MVNPALYIAHNFPDFNERRMITELDLSNKNLEGEISFEGFGFTSLQKINLSNNKLTKIFFTAHNNIKWLDLSNNQLKEIDKGSYKFKNLEYGEILQNDFSHDFQKKWLTERWKFYKNRVWNDYSDLLVPETREIIELLFEKPKPKAGKSFSSRVSSPSPFSDDLKSLKSLKSLESLESLESLFSEYDFSQTENENYNNLIGNKILRLGERELAQASQQYIAFALIVQNCVCLGENDEYEAEMMLLAKQPEKVAEMYNNVPSILIQREVKRFLEPKKDWLKEWQNNLRELEKLLEIKRSSFLGIELEPINFESIKGTISRLVARIREHKTKTEELIQQEIILKKTMISLETQAKENEKEKTERIKHHTELIRQNQQSEKINREAMQRVNELLVENRQLDEQLKWTTERNITLTKKAKDAYQEKYEELLAIKKNQLDQLGDELQIEQNKTKLLEAAMKKDKLNYIAELTQISDKSFWENLKIWSKENSIIWWLIGIAGIGLVVWVLVRRKLFSLW